MREADSKIKHTLAFVASDGITIKADAWGDPSARPVILSHGGGQTRHAWDGTAQALAKAGWYAIAYDHRGHGESAWSPDGKYSLNRFADDMRTVSCSLSQPPVVVGASLGGLSALLAQGESAESIFSAVVLVDITPRMNKEGALNIIRFMGDHLDAGFASLDEAAEIIAVYTGRPKRADTSGLEKNLRLGNDGRYRWHWDPNFMQLRSDVGGDPQRLVRAAKNIVLPILLVRGRLSELVTEELAKEFLMLVPHAEYVDVERARHMVAGDRNDIFTDAVLQFLARLKG